MLMLALAAALVTAAPDDQDPRAADAAKVFYGLCVNAIAGKTPRLDTTEFESTKFDPAAARKIKPNLVNEDLWDVHGIKSDASMLVHYGSAGTCTVEIAEANEAAVQKEFEGIAADVARILNAPAMSQQTQKKRIESKDATTLSWRYAASTGNVLMLLTTYPDAKFEVQHVAIISRVR
jgi:hypothetical protein